MKSAYRKWAKRRVAVRPSPTRATQPSPAAAEAASAHPSPAAAAAAAAADPVAAAAAAAEQVEKSALRAPRPRAPPFRYVEQSALDCPAEVPLSTRAELWRRTSHCVSKTVSFPTLLVFQAQYALSR